MAACIKLLRIVGLAEALSFLALLLVAMPLKYFFDRPEAVSIVGMGHGLLFLLLLICVAIAWAAGLPTKLATWAGLAAIVPTGPFWIDGKLKAFEKSAKANRENTSTPPGDA